MTWFSLGGKDMFNADTIRRITVGKLGEYWGGDQGKWAIRMYYTQEEDPYVSLYETESEANEAYLVVYNYLIKKI